MNFKPKLLSYRQFTVLKYVYTSGSVKIDKLLELYQSTVISLFKRGYLKLSLNSDLVSITHIGNMEMRSFQETKLSEMQVKNNPESRQDKFLSSMKRNNPKKGVSNEA